MLVNMALNTPLLFEDSLNVLFKVFNIKILEICYLFKVLYFFNLSNMLLNIEVLNHLPY